MAPSPARNVLVVRLSSLGDVILTAPVYRALKRAWPDCRISVLVKPAFAAALEGNPLIDEVLAYRGLRETLALIARAGFTHLLDLHATGRSLLLRKLARVPETAVYRKDALARRLFVAFGLPLPALQRHTVERYLEALERWGIARDDRENGPADVALGEVGAGRASAPSAGARVLLIQSAFLGDTLLTLPLAREIKSKLPSCRLSVLTLASTAELFKSQWVDEVLVDDKRGAHGGLRGPWKLARQLAGRFDVAIIPHRSFRSALVARLAAVPRRVGFSSSAGRFLLTDRVPFTWLMHDLERNLALLKPLARGVAVRPDESVYLSPDAAAMELVGRRLREAGVPDDAPLVGVHPGSAWPTKRWPAERFAELCRRLAASGARCVLVGGPKDAALCAGIARESAALDWAGKTELSELKALMPRLSLFITNDSGPMHLATACGVRTLAFFGPTTRELGFFPYGPGHRVLEADLACRPCGLHGGRECPHGHFLCMRLITTEAAWRAAQDMLASRAPAARA